MCSDLRILYQNVRGIRTKVNATYRSILNDNFDVIIFTETWLNSNINTNEFIDDRYVVYRRDRESSSSTKCDGGGVLIAVLNKIKSYRMIAWETIYEDLWVNLVIGSATISICAVYISHHPLILKNLR